MRCLSALVLLFILLLYTDVDECNSYIVCIVCV